MKKAFVVLDHPEFAHVFSCADIVAVNWESSTQHLYVRLRGSERIYGPIPDEEGIFYGLVCDALGAE